MKAAQVQQEDIGTPPLWRAAAGGSAQKEDQDFPLVIATMPATRRQTSNAICVAVLLMVAAAIVAPFASIQAARVDAFLPALQSVLCVADFITGALLLAQFSIQPQRAVLLLASGYIFSGSFAFLQTLSFPGAYAPAGLIGDGLNTPAWLFVLWHTTFPATILGYALSKDMTGVTAQPDRWTTISIVATIACVLAAIAGLTWIVATKTQYLPSFYIADVRLQTRLGNQVNLVLCLWSSAALAVLFVRRRTILDLWLLVTLLACMPNFLVAIIASSVRFSVGWYAGRCFVLVSSCMLLGVLLVETMFLYARLARSIILQRREHGNRLLSVDAITAAVAHELRTPLGAISLNASTALDHLRSRSPEFEGMDEILNDIAADAHRAGAIISGIRELSKQTIDRRTLIRVEDAVRLVLKLLQPDLQMNEVSVLTEFQDDLPDVYLNETHLQQVLLNLVKNAIEAMSTVPPKIRRLRLTTRFDGHSTVSLSVQDSGTGIPVENRERIFDPFFTTKSSGMGLGLAISASLLAHYGGKLILVKSGFGGSIFELAMPVEGQHPAAE